MAKQTTTQKRLASVRERMRAAGIDALLVSNPENRQYITGFYGHDDGQDSAGRVLITQDRIALMTDMRYSEQAHEEAPGVEIIDKREKLTVLVNERLDEWGWQRGKTGAAKPVLGIEANHLTVGLYDAIRKAGRSKYRVKATQDIVEPLRAVKDKDEIAMTRRATDITCQTFDHLLEYLKQPGLTEQQVVAEIVTTMLRLGADSAAFAAIVACGPNGARPHAKPGDRVLEPYQPIIIDMGARAGGYCADMTRTVFLDGVPDVWAERYRHVLAAQEACEAGLRAGISGKTADSLARDVLEKAGLAEQFTHSTGHGTGLEIHEAPSLSQRVPDDDKLPEGAIVTIEPGVYLPGQGGIRIEDAAVLTKTGCDILTTSPKNLDAMIIRRHPVAQRKGA
jgi:Xaa-Pro aminopeptidase